MSNIRLTQEDIEATIVSEEYTKMGKKTTVCLLTLRNGFEIIGTSGCVDPANFNEAIGRKFAKEQAVEKIWQLEGYRLQCSLS